jgi:hypothetical protein
MPFEHLGRQALGHHLEQARPSYRSDILAPVDGRVPLARPSPMYNGAARSWRGLAVGLAALGAVGAFLGRPLLVALVDVDLIDVAALAIEQRV